MKRWRGILIGLLVLAGAVVLGWVLVFKPVPVIMHEVASGDVTEHIPGAGAIECPRVVQPGFEVTGRITSLLVDQGDRVKAGDEIARIDDEVYRAEESAAVEAAALARVSLDRLRAEIKRAEAQHAGAVTHARRQEEAFKSNTISRDLLDQALERAGVAEAELERAKAALAEGESRLAAELRALEVSRAKLQRTVLHSPIDGIVLARLSEPGDVAVPGGAVLRLGSTEGVWASVWVDETFLPQIKPGQAATVELRSAPGSSLQGRVLRVGREVDRETRELLVDIELTTPPEQLAVGQRADARIHGAAVTGVTRVPSEFLVFRSNGAFAWVNDGGRAALREVVPGVRGRDWVEIRGGLSAGDTVMRPTPGARGELTDGARVTAREPAP
ncbi:MAG: efflux RND transporter periplasmic adaptor subunit [Planctomycetes bacterium]|nr:efflux RND transporter periplasmic adaptor subunit [Planctomycetota bacterium]